MTTATQALEASARIDSMETIDNEKRTHSIVARVE
jgi:hypothetical protein